MDDAPTRTEVSPPAPPEVSGPPGVLLVALWIPVAAVVVWSMTRLFAGRWPDEPEPGPLRPPPDDDPSPGA